MCLAACCAPAARALAAVPGNNNDFRGGKVEWARLHNPGVYWNRHAEADPELLDFIRRNTTLNIDPVWRAASPKILPDLCNYPFLFTDRVENLPAADARNLAEYLRRGGFLFIDCCCNTGINPSPDAYLANQLKFLQAMLPEAHIEAMPDNHGFTPPTSRWRATRLGPNRATAGWIRGFSPCAAFIWANAW
jgi:hypothetical protein